MSTVARRSAGFFPEGTVETAVSLGLPDGVKFNDWRRVGEAIRSLHEKAQWSLGDWRRYGKRFEETYSDGVRSVDRADESIRTYAWVAEAFSAERRRPSLTFRHHQLVASKSEAEQDLWLNECERQGWGTRELEERVREAKISGPRPVALSVRATGEVVARFEARAAVLGVAPRDLALDVLELASQLDDPVGVLEAAGARKPVAELEAA